MNKSLLKLLVIGLFTIIPQEIVSFGCALRYVSFVQLQNKLNELNASLRCESRDWYEKMTQKVKIIAEELAKKEGCKAIVMYDEDRILYIDPQYDITQLLIGRLNEDYAQQRAATQGL